MAFVRKINSSEELVNWKKKFTDAGCNGELIDFVLKQKVIKNYDNLYQQFMRLLPSMRDNISNPWELFCLSGEPAALDFAMGETENSEQKKIDAEYQIKSFTAGKYGITPMDYIILSGKADQLKKGLEHGKNEPFNKSNNATLKFSADALNFAALGGSENMIDMVVTHDSTQLTSTPKKGRTPLHYAAAGGSKEAINKLLSYSEIKITALDLYGHNALVYSTAKDRYDASDLLKSKGLVLNEDHVKEHSFGDIDDRYRPQPQNRG